MSQLWGSINMTGEKWKHGGWPALVIPCLCPLPGGKGREQSSISRHLDFLLRKPLVPSLEFEPCLFTGIVEWS